jgi:hypothetical protein
MARFAGLFFRRRGQAFLCLQFLFQKVISPALLISCLKTTTDNGDILIGFFHKEHEGGQ